MTDSPEWIQVFKTGRHVDNGGRALDVDEATLDEIARRYNPSEHEAPLVIGHPKDSDPAFGWVESLKREGQVLYAKVKQLVPEFVDLLKRGLFKKRSISLYPDMTLRHVGFLGAMPPAVKGLQDIPFAKDHSERSNTMTFEFSGPNSSAPGDRLHQRTLELMNTPPKADRLGRPLPSTLSYSEAFTLAQMEDPACARDYAEDVIGITINQ